MLSLRHLLRSKARRMVSALNRSLAMIEFDLEGTIRTANAEFCRLMGYDAAELVGRSHSMFVDPAYAASPAYREF